MSIINDVNRDRDPRPQVPMARVPNVRIRGGFNPDDLPSGSVAAAPTSTAPQPVDNSNLIAPMPGVPDAPQPGELPESTSPAIDYPTQQELLAEIDSSVAGQLTFERQRLSSYGDSPLYSADIYGNTPPPDISYLDDIAPIPQLTGQMRTLDDMYRSSARGFSGQPQGTLSPTGNALQSRGGGEQAREPGLLETNLRSILGLPELVLGGLWAGFVGNGDPRPQFQGARDFLGTVGNIVNTGAQLISGGGGLILPSVLTRPNNNNPIGETGLSQNAEIALRQLTPGQASDFSLLGGNFGQSGTGGLGAAQYLLGLPGGTIRAGVEALATDERLSRPFTELAQGNVIGALQSLPDAAQATPTLERELGEVFSGNQNTFMASPEEGNLTLSPVRPSLTGVYLPESLARVLPQGLVGEDGLLRGTENISGSGSAVGFVLDLITDVPGDFVVDAAFDAATRGARAGTRIATRQANNVAGEVAQEAVEEVATRQPLRAVLIPHESSVRTPIPQVNTTPQPGLLEEVEANIAAGIASPIDPYLRVPFPVSRPTLETALNNLDAANPPRAIDSVEDTPTISQQLGEATPIDTLGTSDRATISQQAGERLPVDSVGTADTPTISQQIGDATPVDSVGTADTPQQSALAVRVPDAITRLSTGELDSSTIDLGVAVLEESPPSVRLIGRLDPQTIAGLLPDSLVDRSADVVQRATQNLELRANTFLSGENYRLANQRLAQLETFINEAVGELYQLADEVPEPLNVGTHTQSRYSRVESAVVDDLVEFRRGSTLDTNPPSTVPTRQDIIGEALRVRGVPQQESEALDIFITRLADAADPEDSLAVLDEVLSGDLNEMSVAARRDVIRGALSRTQLLIEDAANPVAQSTDRASAMRNSMRLRRGYDRVDQDFIDDFTDALGDYSQDELQRKFRDAVSGAGEYTSLQPLTHAAIANSLLAKMDDVTLDALTRRVDDVDIPVPTQSTVLGAAQPGVQRYFTGSKADLVNASAAESVLTGTTRRGGVELTLDRSVAQLQAQAAIPQNSIRGLPTKPQGRVYEVEAVFKNLFDEDREPPTQIRQSILDYAADKFGDIDDVYSKFLRDTDERATWAYTEAFTRAIRDSGLDTEPEMVAFRRMYQRTLEDSGYDGIRHPINNIDSTRGIEPLRTARTRIVGSEAVGSGSLPEQYASAAELARRRPVSREQRAEELANEIRLAQEVQATTQRAKRNTQAQVREQLDRLSQLERETEVLARRNALRREQSAIIRQAREDALRDAVEFSPESLDNTPPYCL